MLKRRMVLEKTDGKIEQCEELFTIHYGLSKKGYLKLYNQIEVSKHIANELGDKVKQQHCTIAAIKLIEIFAQ